jgi:hypothetical protein
MKDRIKLPKLRNCDFCKTRHDDSNFHADFDIDPYPGLGVILIKDYDEGNRSVTNDIEYVLFQVKEIIPDLTKYRIIYRDSAGMYDGIKHENGKFISFYSINETDFQNAVNVARY